MLVPWRVFVPFLVFLLKEPGKKGLGQRRVFSGERMQQKKSWLGVIVVYCTRDFITATLYDRDDRL